LVSGGIEPSSGVLCIDFRSTTGKDSYDVCRAGVLICLRMSIFLVAL
jgi:hypothetical protein